MIKQTKKKYLLKHFKINQDFLFIKLYCSLLCTKKTFFNKPHIIPTTQPYLGALLSKIQRTKKIVLNNLSTRIESKL
jgi:hypothetical protein